MKTPLSIRRSVLEISAVIQQQPNMRVLVLGVTGRVGSRLIPALLAHKHEVVAYIRTASKISAEVTAKLNSVVVG